MAGVFQGPERVTAGLPQTTWRRLRSQEFADRVELHVPGDLSIVASTTFRWRDWPASRSRLVAQPREELAAWASRPSSIASRAR